MEAGKEKMKRNGGKSCITMPNNFPRGHNNSATPVQSKDVKKKRLNNLILCNMVKTKHLIFGCRIVWDI